jgi:hypothetical protein
MWNFRLHPGQLRNFGRRRKELSAMCDPKKFNCVYELSTLPLPAILRHIDVHATGLSTIIMEAESFAIPSVATDLDVLGTYPDQVKSGIVIIAKDSQELIEGIKKQLAAKPQLPFQINSFGHSLSHAVNEILAS